MDARLGQVRSHPTPTHPHTHTHDGATLSRMRTLGGASVGARQCPMHAPTSHSFPHANPRRSLYRRLAMPDGAILSRTRTLGGASVGAWRCLIHTPTVHSFPHANPRRSLSALGDDLYTSRRRHPLSHTDPRRSRHSCLAKTLTLTPTATRSFAHGPSAEPPFLGKAKHTPTAPPSLAHGPSTEPIQFLPPPTAQSCQTQGRLVRILLFRRWRTIASCRWVALHRQHKKCTQTHTHTHTHAHTHTHYSRTDTDASLFFTASVLGYRQTLVAFPLFLRCSLYPFAPVRILFSATHILSARLTLGVECSCASSAKTLHSGVPSK